MPKLHNFPRLKSCITNFSIAHCNLAFSIFVTCQSFIDCFSFLPFLFLTQCLRRPIIFLPLQCRYFILCVLIRSGFAVNPNRIRKVILRFIILSQFIQLLSRRYFYIDSLCLLILPCCIIMLSDGKNLLFCVTVLAKRIKCGFRFGKQTVRKLLFALLIRRFFYHCFRIGIIFQRFKRSFRFIKRAVRELLFTLLISGLLCHC